MKNMSAKIETSKPVAPEDIRPGDFLSVLYVVLELLSCSPFEGVSPWEELSVRRVRFTPWQTDGPLKVVEVCLPYVLAQQRDGSHRTIDVRRYCLARVSKRFGQRVFKKFKGSATSCIAI